MDPQRLLCYRCTRQGGDDCIVVLHSAVEDSTLAYSRWARVDDTGTLCTDELLLLQE